MNPENPNFRTEEESSLIQKLRDELAAEKNKNKVLDQEAVDMSYNLNNLNEQLSAAKKVIEFYADISKWVSQSIGMDPVFVGNDLEYQEKINMYKGGKRAREFLNKESK